MGGSLLAAKSLAFHLDRAVARVRGLEICFALLTWGLRPRLYASACFAGLDRTFCAKPR